MAPRAGPRPEPSREPADEPAEESLEDRRDESPEPLREDGDGALPEAATPLEADPPAPAPALPAPAPSAAPPVVGEDDWSPARPRTPIAVGLGELSPEEQFRELQLGLRLCLAELPRLERRVLALRAGLGVPTPWSRRRVARTLGLSPERVGNLERRGLRRLERLVGRDGCTSDERSTGADTTVAGGSGATGGRGETDQATLAVPAPRRADRTRLDDPVPGARRPHRGAARPDPARPESAVGAGIADRGSALDVPAVLAGLALVLAGVALARRALHRRRPLANAPGSPRVPRQAAEPGPLWASLDKRATDGAPRAYVGRRPRS